MARACGQYAAPAIAGDPGDCGKPLASARGARAGGHFAQSVFGLRTTETRSIAFTRAGSKFSGEGAVGYVSPGCTVQIVDEEDARLPHGIEGTVRLQTPSMIDSYFEAPELTV
jgi:acyl-CoA synthetase (AMP-forming)/AMP-acid ligase II